MIEQAELTLSKALKTIHQAGWYMTLRYEKGSQLDRAQTGKEFVQISLRHLVEQGVKVEAWRVVDLRCGPILEEARLKRCLSFKMLHDWRGSSIRLKFNNGTDLQYSRSCRLDDVWEKYGLHYDGSFAEGAVQSFFLRQPDIISMRHEVRKRS